METKPRQATRKRIKKMSFSPTKTDFVVTFEDESQKKMNPRFFRLEQYKWI